ncbi:MAG: NAD(+)/NADH kinase [Clostridia bacterium]|nr:NAD(+)/NADH kinase [Clostridia bacterium]
MKKIAVIPNYTKDTEYVYTKRLLAYLDGKAQVFMQEKDSIDGVLAEFVQGDVFDGVDAAIVLGGDGTMIRVAEQASAKAIPVMGINLGKVGFLTEVETDDMETACARLLADDFTVEERMMMEISLESGDTYVALNDLVIYKNDAPMIETEIYAGEGKTSEYMSDGIIISTPTGSTGYSLSAGGPVADPAMSLFIATPICAHTLSARPMLMSEYKDITVKLNDKGGKSAKLQVDGMDKCVINSGETVIVRRAGCTFNTIKLGKQSFYYTMMAKL